MFLCTNWEQSTSTRAHHNMEILRFYQLITQQTFKGMNLLHESANHIMLMLLFPTNAHSDSAYFY
jgi:hypothetical protein